MVFIYGHLLIPWFMYYAFLRFDLLRAFFGSFVKTFLVDRLLKLNSFVTTFMVFFTNGCIRYGQKYYESFD